MTSPPLPEGPYKDFSRRVWDTSVQNHLPLKVQFEITYRCNIHCVHCYTDPFNTPFHLRKELTPDSMFRIFDELAEEGVLWMLLTGGEAIVHPQFKQIYREAKARGFIVSLYSNGTVFTDDMADFLAQDPPFQIEVSCHGATPETFDKVAQVPHSFQRFQEGIQRILDRKLPLKIKTKAMTLNQEELPKIKALVEEWGLKFNLYTKIQPRLNGDLSSTQYRLPAKEIIELEYADVLKTSDSELEEDSCNTQFLPPADDRLFRCGCGGNTVTISPYGLLRPCTFTTWPQYDLQTTPFQEAFNRLVQTIREARYTGNSPCRTCGVYSVCDKNPAAAVYETGSMEAPVPYFCDLAFGRQARLKGK